MSISFVDALWAVLLAFAAGFGVSLIVRHGWCIIGLHKWDLINLIDGAGHFSYYDECSRCRLRRLHTFSSD